MQKTNPVQTNFASGELSPTLFGRTDIERYFGGAAQLENFIVRPGGAIDRRVGSRYLGLAATQTTGQNVRLVEFVFSRTEAVAIEISVGKIRFIKDRALVLSSDTPYQVTNIYGTGTAIPYTNSEINELQFTQSADVIYITHPNHKPATLSRYGATDWRYEQPEFDYGPYQDQQPGDQNFSLTVMNVTDTVRLKSTVSDDFSGVSLDDLVEYPFQGLWVLGRVTQLVSGSEIDVEPLEDRSLSFSKEVYSPGLYSGWDGTNSVPLYTNPIEGTDVQVAFSNTGVLTQESVGNYVRFMDKDGAYYWMLVTGIADIVRMGSYGIIAIGDILNVVVPSGIVTRYNRLIEAQLIASDTTFFDLSIDVPRLWRLVLGGQVVHARSKADAGNNGYTLKVELNRPLPRSREGLAVVDDGTTNDWNCGAWYPGNYPTTVFFHEERLGFAGTYDEPHTGWLSKTADFLNFAATDEKLRVMDDSAITFTVASDTMNQILWAVSKKVLICGTAGGEFVVSASGGSDTALSPTNVMVQAHSSYGSEFVKPLVAGKSLIYLQRAGRKLRKMEYDYASDGMQSLDLTVFADHICKENGGAQQLTYQLLPESIIFARLGNGLIGVLTYEEDQQVYAWSRFRLGGSGIVESIACIPENDRYILYCVVKRTINGATQRTIEYIEPEKPSSSSGYTGVAFPYPCLDCYVSEPAGLTYTDYTDPGEGGGGGGGGTPLYTDIGGLTLFAGKQVTLCLGPTAYTATVGADGVFPGSGIGVITPGAHPVVVGYPAPAILQTLPLETQGLAGTAQAKVKRIDNISLRLIRSGVFKHGISLSSLRSEPYSRTATIYEYTGDFRFPCDESFNVRSQYFIYSDSPFPLSILSFYPEVGVHQ